MGVWTVFSRLSFLSSFSLSLGDNLVQTEILSQRAVKPKTTNQPNLMKNEQNTVKLIALYLKEVGFILKEISANAVSSSSGKKSIFKGS